jgi:hypothetical protein
MVSKDATVRRWWPSTQSLDLVEGPVQRVAEALRVEFLRFAGAERVAAGWHRFDSLDAAFRSAPNFDNVVTFLLALPTRSKWTVLWNNSFLCDGYDSLCWCLTSHHDLTTIHWAAHDDWTTFQSGASFTTMAPTSLNDPFTVDRKTSGGCFMQPANRSMKRTLQNTPREESGIV